MKTGMGALVIRTVRALGGPKRGAFFSSRYRGPNENFVPVSPHQAIQAVELATFLFGQDAVAAEWRHEAGRKRCVDLFEELEEDQADRVALAGQSIATGAWDLLYQAFGAQFGKVIAKRQEFGRTYFAARQK
jgi:hypothetical protein